MHTASGSPAIFSMDVHLFPGIQGYRFDTKYLNCSCYNLSTVYLVKLKL